MPGPVQTTFQKINPTTRNYGCVSWLQILPVYRKTLTGGFSCHHPLVNLLTYGTPQCNDITVRPTTLWILIPNNIVNIHCGMWYILQVKCCENVQLVKICWAAGSLGMVTLCDTRSMINSQDKSGVYRGVWSTNQQAFEPFGFLPCKVNTFKPCVHTVECGHYQLAAFSLLKSPKCCKALFWLVELGY